MNRLGLLILVIELFAADSFGQIKVFKDEKGQILTTVESNGTGDVSVGYHQTTYLGSPFLNYPIWQRGSIKLDKAGKNIACQLAYNAVNNEVLCRFDNDSTGKTITPESFIVNGKEFVRQQNKLLGIDYHLYATIIHNGPTQLLQSLTKHLDRMNSAELVNNRYNKDLNIYYMYRPKTSFYIRKGDARPELISLTKKSLLAVLYDQSLHLEAKTPDKPLTTFEVIDIINYYDSLNVAARTGTYPLSQHPLFNQTLHSSITYPAWVGNQGIYGRVYAGFAIDSLGEVNNIAILSPGNAGFGFTQQVQKALEKMPNLDPSYKGTYVLPVTFTFTNSAEQTGPHIPVNALPNDRIANRIVLDEFVVPYVVSQKGITSREVWGYYK